ncbi:efflux RND transporter periplasmic adaptor subunit [Sphingomonas naphthae]|uniref:Efflux RND transporter periplasmic adaptor subunit n=1 Tax=Sphingomonas naphthae TaxID=1813468 RepID=A0ABY7TPQ8_9SPHN|nr:efflux RND transporter periplasmic adaptor subunit [Sphingomonas naphthae]WCT75229.1 efflux RND transporter periplasmic adaptor subunit [Sphingomonas naphthae]
MNMEAFSRFEADQDMGAPRRRRRILIAGIVVVLLVLVIGATMMMRGGKPAGPKGPTLPHVTVTVPGTTTVARVINATGTVAARRDMPVGIAGEGGQVVRVLVEQGTWVKRGQVLAVIDRSVQTEQASSLAAQIAVAQADAKLAQANLDRAIKLVDRGFISRADIDARTATRDQTVARVRVAQAQLAEQRARIGRLNIVSPTDGLVLTRSIEAGQIVGGSGTLFRVAANGNFEVLTRLAESDLATLKVGLPAKVTPVGQARTIDGQIWQLSPIIDPTSRQGVARVALTYDPALRPGGFAAVAITGGSTTAPLLPESAVQSDAKGNYVYLIDGADKVVRRDVKVGGVDDRGVTVTDGLTGTERVVVSAGAFLNIGDKVIPELLAKGR